MILFKDLGEGVKSATLTQGDFSATVLSYGCILQSFKIANRDVVLGFDNWKSYIGCSSYMGEVVGPFANRIAGAHFTLEGKEFELEKNNGNNSLHSGSKNFGNKKFEIAGYSDSSVTFSLISQAEGGFDVVHEVMVTYMLSEDGILTLDYQLSSDSPCPANMTNHSYFNLKGKGDIRDHRLIIPASSYIRVDDELIPISVDPVDDTDFDFRSGALIGDRRNGAYDHCFVLDDDGALVAECDGIRLTMRTTCPGVQLYTGEFLEDENIMKNGLKPASFSGFCLESEYYPDFPNRPDFKGLYSAAGAIVHFSTSYKLEKL